MAAVSKLELQDEISKRLAQAAGICALAGVCKSGSESIPDAALPNAMWAVRDLIAETEELVGRLAGVYAPIASGAEEQSHG